MYSLKGPYLLLHVHTNIAAVVTGLVLLLAVFVNQDYPPLRISLLAPTIPRHHYSD
jgi:hypothetical protein